MDSKNHDRLSLHSLLQNLLGSNNVYYQPPENLKMEYPCIRYSRSEIRDIYGDDMKYISRNVYDLVVISKKPDNPVIDKLLSLPYSEFDRHYVSDNLNHDIIRIFY
jgi:hypothetical protein